MNVNSISNGISLTIYSNEIVLSLFIWWRHSAGIIECFFVVEISNRGCNLMQLNEELLGNFLPLLDFNCNSSFSPFPLHLIISTWKVEICNKSKILPSSLTDSFRVNTKKAPRERKKEETKIKPHATKIKKLQMRSETISNYSGTQHRKNRSVNGNFFVFFSFLVGEKIFCLHFLTPTRRERRQQI